MSAPIQTSEPAHLRAGDTASWQITLPDYPASAGWSLAYTLINASAKISFTSSASGDAHRVSVPPATTSGWSAGTYAWQCRVSKAGEAYTVATGSITIDPDFAAAGIATLDARTHAQKTLDAIEAWIERHDLAVADYQIAGRAMKYVPISELLKLRDAYRREVRGQSGKSGRVYVRF